MSTEAELRKKVDELSRTISFKDAQIAVLKAGAVHFSVDKVLAREIYLKDRIIRNECIEYAEASDLLEKLGVVMHDGYSAKTIGQGIQELYDKLVTHAKIISDTTPQNGAQQ